MKSNAGSAMFALNADEKLNAIYEFLKRNHAWNHKLQLYWNRFTLSHCSNAKSRLKALLYSVVKTQPKADLDRLESFWRDFDRHPWPSRGDIAIRELNDFLHDRLSLRGKAAQTSRRLKGDLTDQPLSELFELLKRQDGWGNKTAALFVKNVIRIHRSKKRQLHFLAGGAQLVTKATLRREKKLHLPVDNVILHIFKKYVPSKGKSFSSINNHLHKAYDSEQMLIWDNLWLWGFITQNSKSPSKKKGRPLTTSESRKADKRKNERAMKWNPGKFWSLQFYTFENESQVKALAEEFINIIKG